MKDRIRFVRERLELSRAEFGKRIGVSGDVINNIERGRAAIKEYTIKLICNEYAINEQWLRTGEGKIDDPDPQSLLFDFAETFDCTHLEMKFLTSYFCLEEQERMAFCKLLAKMFPSILSEVEGSDPFEKVWQEAPPIEPRPATSEKYLTEMSRDELHKEIDRQLDEEKNQVENPAAYWRGKSGTATG